MLTRPIEGQTVRYHVGCEEVIRVILPQIGFVGHITQEDATRLLVSQMKETCVMMAQVRFKVKKEVDLMGVQLASPFKFIENIECREHSISIGVIWKGQASK